MMNKVCCAIAVVIVLFTSVLSLYRNVYWKDTLTMGIDMVTKSPSKARTYANRGISLELHGGTDAALREYDTAMRLEPTFTTS